LLLLLGGSVPLGLTAVHHPALASPSATAKQPDPPPQAVAPSGWEPREQVEPWLAARKFTPSPGSTPSAPGLPGTGGLILAADTSELGIPTLVLQAYLKAAAELAIEQPGCHLPWWLLAGIGHVESGQAEGGRLYADGTTRGRILGPELNGSIPGDAVVRDTDHGVLDGDPVYDRAVGPMQFLPGTWARWGADGNGDGKADPNNIFDASLAAARYLCADGRDLATSAGIDAAVLSYNHSNAYLALVLEWGHAYQIGAIATDGTLLPVITDVVKVRSTTPPPKPIVKVVEPSGHPSPSRSPSRQESGSPSASSSSSSDASSSSSSSASSSDASSESASALPTCTSASATASGSSDSPQSSAAAPSTSDESSAAAQSSTADPSTDGQTSSSAVPSDSATTTRPACP
jgi:hypothetical protein